MKTKTLWILLGICIVGLIISLWYAVSVTINHKEIPDTKQDIIDDCKNFSLVRTAECLNEDIRTFYRYRFSIYEPTFQDLKDYGGTCMDWSNLYKDLALELGFYADLIPINMTERTGHMITLISNREGYCILDSKNLYCNDNLI